MHMFTRFGVCLVRNCDRYIRSLERALEELSPLRLLTLDITGSLVVTIVVVA